METETQQKNHKHGVSNPPIIIIISGFGSDVDSSHDPNSLDSLFFSLAARTSFFTHPTGTPYQVPLPSNFSGMGLSAIKLRTKSFWQQGVNLTSIGNVSVSIPPEILPWPFVNRVIVLFYNLGNWSAEYNYDRVPGYSLAAPVVGFDLYDSSNLTELGSPKLPLGLSGNRPVSLRFATVLIDPNVTAAFQCVRFGEGGAVELNDMTEPNQCQTNSPGRFSIVAPAPPPPPPEKPAETEKEKKEKEQVRDSVVAVAVIVIAATVVVLIGCLLSWCAWRRRIRKMEEESEKDVTINTFWVGHNKMPTASMTRTQPVIEHTDVP